MIGERNILCMDWDERSLRILDVRLGRSRVRVNKAVCVPVPEHVNVHDPAALGAFLKRTLAEHRIRTRRVMVDVPRQDAVLNLLSLPQGSADEMAAMVHVQAAKELPFTKDQAVVDYAVARECEGGMCEVWMAAVRTSVVDRFRQVIAAAGLKLDRVGLRPYANVASLDPAELADRRVLMVDIAPTMTEISVIDEGRLAFSRAASVTIPAEGLLGKPADRETAPSREKPASMDDGIPFVEEPDRRPNPMETLLIEVSRTVEAYRATTPGATIEQIVLAGTMGTVEPVVERFEKRFGVPCRVYRLPTWLKWPGSDAPDAVFSVVVGLAVSATAEGMAYFDFLHPKEPEAAQRVRRRQRPLLAATVALFVVAAGVMAYQPIRHRKAQIAELELARDLKNRDKDARKLMLDQFQDYQAWRKTDVVWIDQLLQMAEAFPPNLEAYITKIEFTEKGRITVDLAAKDEMVATMIVDKLAQIKDTKGRPIFTAKPGKTSESTDKEYPVKDQIFVEIESLREAS